MRLGAAHFRVVTGGATGMAEKKWFTDHLPADGTAALADLTSAWTTLGLWGPRARDVMQAVSADDYSHPGFPFGTCREVEVGGLTVLASRISYVGELGWELYVPMEQGAGLWDALWEAGAGHGLVPVGIGVYGTTGRLEKGYRALRQRAGSRLQPGRGRDDPPEGEGARVHRQGRLPGAAGAPPVAVLCTLTVDDHRSASGQLRYMLGGEPILSADGELLVDAKGRPSYVTSAGSGPSTGKHLLMAYLPAEQARRGRACSSSTSASAIRSRSPSPARRPCSTRETSGSGVSPAWRSSSASSASRRSAARSW